MADLVRKIEEEDIPKLHELMGLVFEDTEWSGIERLGGMTNHSYKITRRDGKEYLVRIPGEGTEEMINRLDERKSTELACSLGIDSELLYFGDDGRKVMRFIHNPQPIDESVMQKDENILQAANIFRKLHTCGIDTGVRFEVFEMAALYEKIILDGGVALYDDYYDVHSSNNARFRNQRRLFVGWYFCRCFILCFPSGYLLLLSGKTKRCKTRRNL